MEDDHVDRPGVEERQRLKLTGTNSSIGLIVLIPYAHLTRSDGLFSLTLVPPCGRRYVGAVHQRRRSVDLAKLRFERRQDQKNCKGTKKTSEQPREAPDSSAADVSLCFFAQKASRTTCVLPTWWLWRSGCTRSHSELGRETLQR